MGSFVPVVRTCYNSSRVYGFDIPFVFSQWDKYSRISNLLIKCEHNPYYEMQEVDISKYKLLVYEGKTEIDQSKQVYSSPLRCPEDYVITGLKWGSDYIVTYGCELDGGDSYINYYTPLEASTKAPTVRLSSVANQLSVNVKVNAEEYNPEKPENLRVTCGDVEYPCDKNGEVKIPNLRPGTKYTITASADYDGVTASSSAKTFNTVGLIGGISSEALTPTTAVLTGNIAEGDAVVVEYGFEELGKGSRFQITGLSPSTSYSYTFYVVTDNGIEETKTVSFKTPAVELSMLDPRCVSEKCAIVAAETNLSDMETNAGFQWKKYDAPSTLKPSEAYAAIYGGQLEGYIKNLQPTYYNVRAFFEDAAGDRTYTDWVTFDPTDFSFFEPTVHTYPVQGVSNTEATVRGYALAGTDPIIGQGFQYWKAPGAAGARMKAPSADKIYTVQADGQMMTATLTDLEPGTEYVLRSYVETAAGYAYGEEQTFTTSGSAGIGYIEADGTEAEIVGYYDLTGRRYDAPQKGFNIVVYSDGSSRKEFVR